ncbi:MAG: hypothetical protein EOP50_04510 [Sphingobacteriales bacterium]|nr:MAG: hypothetical protein EOP50_04510 [Sphingobacteriales bacterium]
MLLTRNLLLSTLAKHETLTITDISKVENLGVVPDLGELRFLLGWLVSDGMLQVLPGVCPVTYTITNKGIGISERPGGIGTICTQNEDGRIY